MDAIERENLLQIIRKQIVLYSQFGVQDLYKLICQITRGPAHFVPETDTLRDHLFSEWHSLNDPFFHESLVEKIDPLQKIIRVNLRPFREQGGTAEQILSLFGRSIKEFEPDPGRLEHYWNAMTQMAEAMELPFTRNVLAAFWAEMQEKDFPPAPHSKAYRKYHKPAYRLVLTKYWEGKDSDE